MYRVRKLSLGIDKDKDNKGAWVLRKAKERESKPFVFNHSGHDIITIYWTIALSYKILIYEYIDMI
jgi:hypothetical protein